MKGLGWPFEVRSQGLGGRFKSQVDPAVQIPDSPCHCPLGSSVSEDEREHKYCLNPKPLSCSMGGWGGGGDFQPQEEPQNSVIPCI